jgi:hypothetical protein
MTAIARHIGESAMSRITLDAELRKKLGDLTHVVELCDESGRVIGQIVPARTNRHELPFTEAELDREVDDTTEWYSSDDIKGMLKSLEGR